MPTPPRTVAQLAEKPPPVRRRQARSKLVTGRSSSQRYSRSQIVEAIRRWTTLHGGPPKQVDWDPARALREGHEHRHERFHADQWPTAKMVRGSFGTFTEALREAGYERPRSARTKAQLRDSTEVLRAIRQWTARYGEPPTNADWDTSRARRLDQEWRVVRYEADDWPSLTTVRAHYGSLRNAIDAAGLLPSNRNIGVPGRADARRRNLVALARREAASLPQPSPGDLARALRLVAAARRRDDPQALRHSLVLLASTALAWAARG